MGGQPDQNDAFRQGRDLDQDMHRTRMTGEGESRADEAKLPLFPIDVLPERFQRIAQHFAAAVNKPVDLVMPAFLSVPATALGPHWKVGARSFVRSPLLWFALVAPSGSGKTPAARPILRPNEKRDRRYRDAYEEEMKGYEATLREWNRASKKKAGDPGPKPDKPARRRAVLTDATPEGLVMGLQHSPDGLLFHSNELAQLLGSFDTYHAKPGKGRAIYLNLWDGAPISEGRKVAHACEVDDPYAVIYGGIQPSRLASLELADGDGLTARFLWSVPEIVASGLGRDVSPLVEDAWAGVIAHAFDQPDIGVQRFDLEAECLLDAQLAGWQQLAIDHDQAGEGLLSSFYGKAGDYLMRLTALLHGMDALAVALEVADPDGQAVCLPELPGLVSRTVPKSTLERALRLVEYYLAHGRAVVARVISAEGEPARAPNRDAELVAGLLAVLDPGETVEDTPASWCERLREAGVRLSPDSLGRAFARIRDTGHEKVEVIQPTRREARL